MALGVIKIIPASSHTEFSLTGGGTSGGGNPYPAISILNPNDGVAYVAQNRDCLGTGYGSWDWKVPSQSYALLPGPFQSVGIFYLDQSGAGRQGEITVYPSQRIFDVPLFNSIGRALQAQATTLDVTEGASPPNPGSGILRLWADGTDILHAITGDGLDRTFIDSVRQLGGVLSGTLPNPTFSSQSVSRSAFSQISAAGSTTSTTPVLLDSVSFTSLTANSSIRLDWSGAVYASLNNTIITIWTRIDGGAWQPIGRANVVSGGTSLDAQISVYFEYFSLAAGAHTFDIGWTTSQGTASVDTGVYRQMAVRELRT